MNQPIQEYHTFDLKSKVEFSQKNYFLQSNTSLLYKLLILEQVHFGFYLTGGRNALAIGLAFSLYFWITIRKYQRYSHLKSPRILIPALLQQAFLLVIGFFIGINFTSTDGGREIYKVLSQKTLFFLFESFLYFVLSRLVTDIIVMIQDLGLSRAYIIDEKRLNQPCLVYKFTKKKSTDPQESKNLLLQNRMESNPKFEAKVDEEQQVITQPIDSTIVVKEIPAGAKAEKNQNFSVLAVEDSNSMVKIFESGSVNEKTIEKLNFQETIKKPIKPSGDLQGEE